jgi:hypothetical protein
MTREEWEPIAARIRGAWPDFSSGEATANAYVSALADLDARAVSRAVDGLLREPREHAPPPGVIRDRVLRPDAPPAAPVPPPEPPSGGGSKMALAMVVGGLAVALITVLVVLGVRKDEATTPTVTHATTRAGTVTVQPPSRSATVTAPERTVTTSQTLTSERTVTAPATGPARTGSTSP